MALSSIDTICIWRSKSLKEKNPLNHVGARYCDDQNEKHPLRTILEQAHALKLNNLASIIANSSKRNSNIYSFIMERLLYLRNKPRPIKRLLEDTQQNSVICAAWRWSDPGLFNFKSQCFYCEKPCIDDKKHPDRKSFEIVSTVKTKIW